MSLPIQFAARTCVAALLGFALMGAAPATPSAPGSPLGEWTTQGGEDVVRIEPCGEALCGRIVGIVRNPGEPIPTDAHGTSQCGLLLINNERSNGHGAWLGQVIDPRNGKVYRAKLWVDDQGALRLRGFVGVTLLGRTQTWPRFTGHVDAACMVTANAP